MTEKTPPLDRPRDAAPVAPPDDTPTPIEIELTPEEIAAAPVAETPAAPESTPEPATPEPTTEQPPALEPVDDGRKKKAPAHVRLAREKQRAEAAEAAAETAAQEAAALRAQIATEQRTSVIHYEARVKVELERAQERLQAAITKGDAAEQVKAADDLAKWRGEATAVDTWKRGNPAPTASPTAAPAPAPARQTPAPAAAPTPDPTTSAWVAANPWFDAEHDDFDQDMHVEAVEFARTLERKYARQGTSVEEAGKAYWDAIDKHVRTEFPDRFPKPGRTPPMTGASNVAAAAPAGGGGTPAPTPGKITLTGEERKFAEALSLRHPDGREYTEREKYIAYARGKTEAEAKRKAAA